MIEVYCDESRPEVLYSNKSRDQYMIIGGIWIPHATRNDLKSLIKLLKHDHNFTGEIKWKNVSPSKIDFYLDLVDLFFQCMSARFRCIVVDSNLVDIHKFHESDSELGFYKFYYQLLKHWVNTKEEYWLYLDSKKNKQPDRLATLKNVLCRATNRRICSAQAIESRQSLLIQLADVLIGAVGYKYHRLGTSESKLAVINRIENHIGHCLSKTPKSEGKFNIFEIDLR